MLRHDLDVVQMEQARVGVDLRARGTAEQLGERLSRALAREVPERDVEAADREDGDAVAAEEMQRLLELMVETHDVAGIAAERHRRHHAVERGLDRGLTVVGEGIAPAHEPVRSLDPHQQCLEPGPGAAAPARGLAHGLEGDLERDRLDARDRQGCHHLPPITTPRASSFLLPLSGSASTS